MPYLKLPVKLSLKFLLRLFLNLLNRYSAHFCLFIQRKGVFQRLMLKVFSVTSVMEHQRSRELSNYGIFINAKTVKANGAC